jgi:hypothetical protein
LENGIHGDLPLAQQQQQQQQQQQHLEAAAAAAAAGDSSKLTIRAKVNSKAKGG